MDNPGNERLKAMMRARGIGIGELQTLTGIPPTTLRRIVDNTVKRIRPDNMRKIAGVLHVPVDAVFDVPTESVAILPIPMEEAGEVVTRTLTRDESLILYWYQQLPAESKRSVFYAVNREYSKCLRMMEQRSAQILSGQDGSGSFEQIEMFGTSADQAT